MKKNDEDNSGGGYFIPLALAALIGISTSQLSTSNAPSPAYNDRLPVKTSYDIVQENIAAKRKQGAKITLEDVKYSPFESDSTARYVALVRFKSEVRGDELGDTVISDLESIVRRDPSPFVQNLAARMVKSYKRHEDLVDESPEEAMKHAYD